MKTPKILKITLNKLLLGFFNFFKKRINLFLPILVCIGILIYSLSSSGFNTNKNTSIDNAIVTQKKSIDLSSNTFKFKDINSTPYDLNGLKGTKNILMYFFNTHCLTCISELNTISSSIPQDKKDSILMVLISNSDINTISNFSKVNKIDSSFIQVSDTENRIYSELNLNPENSLPSLFLFNKNEELINAKYGYSQNSEIQHNMAYLFSDISSTSSSQAIAVIDGYKYSVDSNEIKNACLLSSQNVAYKSKPTQINTSELKKNLLSDDLVNCISSQNSSYVKISDNKGTGSDEVVFVITFNGITKIISRNILVQFPYFEDYFGYMPVGILYDGLTNTINVFSRFINNEERKFLISGRVYKNHFLLIDLKNFSLWDGQKAIGGDDVTTPLIQIPVRQTLYKNLSNLNHSNSFVQIRPQSIVDYSIDPLLAYRTNDTIYYPNTNNKTFLNLYRIKDEVIRIEDQYFLVKDLKLPINGKTKSGLNFLITLDSNGAIAVFDRKILEKIYSFDNSTGVIKETLEQTSPIISKTKKVITPTIPQYISSQWTKDLISTDGPLKGIALKEITPERGFYFYLQ